jgi:CheY-like chemotaxis protein
MDAFGQLAGGVAHDFNNLITAINGYSEITLDKLPPADPLRANLEEIIKAGSRAAALTRQLLAFSRKQVLRPKVIDLSYVVDDMQKLLRRLIGENIKLVTAIEGKLGKVLVDPSQVEQILINLAVNARDAMPRGGKLMIEIGNVYLDKEYARHHLAVTPGPYVMLAVSDTGCGMSRAIQKRIFEPFFTTKEPGKGTGLGLSTVYGIVKQSGGNIWVYSEEGVGTKFKIYLPRIDQPGEDEVQSIERTEVAGGTESILLVEDDDSVRNMILRILRDRGYDVTVARDGREALLLCGQGGREYALLLTDVVMPKMSGRELYGELQRIRPGMRVLYISGYSGDTTLPPPGPGPAGRPPLSELPDLLEKPFTRDELLRRVREVLTYR